MASIGLVCDDHLWHIVLFEDDCKVCNKFLQVPSVNQAKSQLERRGSLPKSDNMFEWHAQYKEN